MLAYMGFFLENQIVSSVLPAGPTEVTMQPKTCIFESFFVTLCAEMKGYGR